MSQDIGATIPPPLRFEFGKRPLGGQPAQALLLITVDADGSPRIAVLSPAEVRAAGESRLRIVVRRGSTTSANLGGRPAALWCVLDGAAYAVRGTSQPSADEPDDSDAAAIELSITSILLDFAPEAPMLGGPTYRAMA